MDMRALILSFGYPVLFAGTMLEGETVLLTAGFLAHQGYMDVWLVGAIAAGGGFCGDQAFFWLGRLRGPVLLYLRPSWRARAQRVLDLAAKHQNWLVLACRFMYGLRIAIPVVLGTARIGPLRFALLNAIGACAWASLFTALGWYFGVVVQSLLGSVKHYEQLLAAGLLGLALLGWAAHHAVAYLRRRR